MFISFAVSLVPHALNLCRTRTFMPEIHNAGLEGTDVDDQRSAL